jgi:hypothetical protein
VEGLAHPLARAVFRVSEIGNFAPTIAGRTIQFKQEVGFGGAVLMQARKPRPRLGGGSLGELGAYLHDLIGIGGGSDD